jgi:hypothetical protein
MEELVKKLTQLTDLLKALKKPDAPKGPALPTLPAIKPPAPPSMTPTKSAAPKIGIGSGPNSKKDPKKVAQQIKDGSMSTKTQKVMLKTDKNGQWQLDEEVEKASRSDIKPESKEPKPLRFPDKPANHPFNRAKDSDIIPFDSNHVDISKPKKPMIKADSKSGQWYLEPTDPSNV